MDVRHWQRKARSLAQAALALSLLAATSAHARADVCTERNQALVALADRWGPFLDRALPQTIFYTGSPNRTPTMPCFPCWRQCSRSCRPRVRRPRWRWSAGAGLASCRCCTCRNRKPAVWEQSLGTHAKLRGRVRGWQVTGRRPSAEIFGGRPLEEMTAFLKLADPTGGLAGATPKMSPARDIIFRGLNDCRKHLELIH